MVVPHVDFVTSGSLEKQMTKTGPWCTIISIQQVLLDITSPCLKVGSEEKKIQIWYS